jgi:hypothetical protein
MEAVLADSGFVVALVNKTDPRHAEVRGVYLQFPQILLPHVVLVKVAYLVGRDVGIPTIIAFLRGIPASRFVLTASPSSETGEF